MRSISACCTLMLCACLFPAVTPASLGAQQSLLTLSGLIASSTGQPIADASIAARNSVTGQLRSAQSGPDGRYVISALAAGSYSVTVSAAGFSEKTAPLTLTSATQTLNLTLTELPSAPAAAPAAAPATPSLSDLGFTQQQTQANPQLQALLDKRTHMLRVHQRLGLITAIPMAAAVITGPMAKAKGRNGQVIREPTQANLDLHAALGGATTALYFTTAYFAIRAPRVPGATKHGAIKWHEALAWVHGPGMVLTPILGYMAYKQENAGEKVHGIASAHGTVAWITAVSYGTAIVAISWPIHFKFWEKNQ